MTFLPCFLVEFPVYCVNDDKQKILRRTVCFSAVVGVVDVTFVICLLGPTQVLSLPNIKFFDLQNCLVATLLVRRILGKYLLLVVMKFVVVCSRDDSMKEEKDDRQQLHVQSRCVQCVLIPDECLVFWRKRSQATHELVAYLNSDPS